MLSPAAVERIQILFLTGHAIEEIAAAAGCGKSTVRTVIDGKHALQRGRRPAERPAGAEPLGRPRRCRGCGGRITHAPCVLCAALASRGPSHARHRRGGG